MGRVPLDVEAIIKQKAEEERNWRPRFIPKKERERMAAEKAAVEKAAAETNTAAEPAAPKRKLDAATNGSSAPSSAASNGVAPSWDGQAANDLPRKRKRRQADKFRFDHSDDEDTSRPPDPVDEELKRRRYSYLTQADKRFLDSRPSPEEGREYCQKLTSSDQPNAADRALCIEAEIHKRIREEEEQRRQKAYDDWERKMWGRNPHWSQKTLEQMKPHDWRVFKETYDITVKGSRLPNPMRSWKESGLPRNLLDVIEKLGYTEPTPIQRAAIPIALQNRDLIGISKTGSGKTAAFVLPLLVYLNGLPPLTEFNKDDGPYALILAPTRELAQQIEAEARKFAVPLGYTCVSIVGGHSVEEQVFSLRNGAEIIVATPGRLVDVLDKRLLVLEQCCYVIIDEADRMMDEGFEQELSDILSALPSRNEKPDNDDAEDAELMARHVDLRHRYRQTMMYTATMRPKVEKIAQKYLRRPATVTIGTAGEAADTVDQRAEWIIGEEKRKKRLQEILSSGAFPAPIIIFVNIKRNCDVLARDVSRMGFSCVALHGGKTQEQREQALASLRTGRVDVLVATDVAGRGIDVANVSLVVNFNMSSNIETYTHRIGRTGRAGNKGVAITFLGNEDTDILYELRQTLAKSQVSRVPDWLKRHEAAQVKPGLAAGRFK